MATKNCNTPVSKMQMLYGDNSVYGNAKAQFHAHALKCGKIADGVIAKETKNGGGDKAQENILQMYNAGCPAAGVWPSCIIPRFKADVNKRHIWIYGESEEGDDSIVDYLTATSMWEALERGLSSNYKNNTLVLDDDCVVEVNKNDGLTGSNKGSYHCIITEIPHNTQVIVLRNYHAESKVISPQSLLNLAQHRNCVSAAGFTFNVLTKQQMDGVVSEKVVSYRPQYGIQVIVISERSPYDIFAHEQAHLPNKRRAIDKGDYATLMKKFIPIRASGEFEQGMHFKWLDHDMINFSLDTIKKRVNAIVTKFDTAVCDGLCYNARRYYQLFTLLKDFLIDYLYTIKRNPTYEDIVNLMPISQNPKGNYIDWSSAAKVLFHNNSIQLRKRGSRELAITCDLLDGEIIKKAADDQSKKGLSAILGLDKQGWKILLELANTNRLNDERITIVLREYGFWVQTNL